MSATTFFRLLQPADKGGALQTAVRAWRDGMAKSGTYLADPTSFPQIPGSPFAYWVSESVRHLFVALPLFEGGGRHATKGLATTDDFRFARVWWEVPGVSAAKGDKWTNFSKGGSFSAYYTDVHLVVNWKDEGRELKEYLDSKIGQKGQWSRWINSIDYYSRPGLTWPRRTQGGFSVRALPAGCIFADKGPSAFTSPDDLSPMLAIMNCTSFVRLVTLQMAFGSYEVGVIQRTPVPPPDEPSRRQLGALAGKCVNLKRSLDTANETSHAFTLPALLQVAGPSLAERVAAWQERVGQTQAVLARHQLEVDEIAYRLYGISDEDRRAIEASLRSGKVDEAEQPAVADDEAEEETSAPTADRRALAADLVSYALGCAFGRWDVRIARDPSLAPKLADPFDPLPICSPGMLVGPDGLPAARERIASEVWLRARPDVISPPADGAVTEPAITADEYPLAAAWDGILVDDDGHEADVVHRVRQVLALLFGERAEEWERDLCAALGVKALRDYLRHPNGFFAEHIGRYSKSRRKAPIYWLLQSDKRGYALWLSCHHIGKDTLHRALNDYVGPKVALEERRLLELGRDKVGADARGDGREARRLLKELDTQEKLVAELYRFRDALKAVAERGYAPDLDDGVVLSIAPLHALVPWKEASAYWKELLVGKYPWASVSTQLRAKGLVRVL